MNPQDPEYQHKSKSVASPEQKYFAHYAMRGKVVVENEDSYNKWLDEQETFS